MPFGRMRGGQRAESSVDVACSMCVLAGPSTRSLIPQRSRSTPRPLWQETRELEMIQQELRKADSGGASDDERYPPVERMDTVAAVAGDDENFVLSDEEAIGARAGEDHSTQKAKSRKCGIGITFRRVSLCGCLIVWGSRSRLASSIVMSRIAGHNCIPFIRRGAVCAWRSAVMECVPVFGHSSTCN